MFSAPLPRQHFASQLPPVGLARSEEPMLCAFWSLKGGSGVSTVAAATAVVLARNGGARLVDCDGDQPSLLGMGADPRAGIAQWLERREAARASGLDELTVDMGRGLRFVPRGDRAVPTERLPLAALSVILRESDIATVIDTGGNPDVSEVITAMADVSILVLRPCYLAFRRVVRTPQLAVTDAVVLLEEPERVLGEEEAANVLNRPVIARVPVLPEIARNIDAGVMPERMDDALALAAAAVIDRFDLRRGRGYAA
jgi:MinD-like ATPase involved in chromosome partitioning or flagellar assembly